MCIVYMEFEDDDSNHFQIKNDYNIKLPQLKIISFCSHNSSPGLVPVEMILACRHSVKHKETINVLTE